MINSNQWKQMTTPQRAIEHLLLVSGASRALLQLRRDSGDFAIAAEAVQHGQEQLRHAQFGADAALLDAASLGAAAGLQYDAPEKAGSGSEPVTARMRAPLSRDGKLVGVVSLHRCGRDEPWNGQAADALHRASNAIAAFLKAGSPSSEARSAAIQAELDQLRGALDVQRCTFRQPVEEAYAFPVTFESRDKAQRSLLGDFTIVQTGQPVIVKLLAERAQVIQEDCRVASTDPLFHKMLAHYGGMRAQMVTPFIVDDQLKGVLSVHELREVRAWTASEKALAAKAAELIGALAESP
jgi:GAF domain-containing protein